MKNGIGTALWTRGLAPLSLPDPLGMDYVFENSWGLKRIDVEGCVLGSDGSGGKYSRHIRTRRCGFGIRIIRLRTDGSFELVGSAFGSVPGKQTVPRSEMTGLLHALMHTKGNAIIEQHGQIQASLELSQNMLRRLLAIAIKVIPSSSAASRVVVIADR